MITYDDRRKTRSVLGHVAKEVAEGRHGPEEQRMGEWRFTTEVVAAYEAENALIEPEHGEHLEDVALPHHAFGTHPRFL
ncbi:MAG: hypothetical protein ACKO6I_11045, partial [Sphingomonadales bacterium]